MNMGDCINVPSTKAIKDAFFEYADSLETLTLEQFKKLCHRFYLSPTNKGIKQLFNELDKNNDDKLSFDEVEILVKKQWTPINERKQVFLDNLRKVRKNDGPITRDELRTILQNGSDEALTEEDIDFCFDKMDINDDNQLSEEELSELIFKMEEVLSRAPSRVESTKGDDDITSRSRSRSNSKGSTKESKQIQPTQPRSRSSSKDSNRSKSGNRHHEGSGKENSSKGGSRNESRNSHHEQNGHINGETSDRISPIHVDEDRLNNDENKAEISIPPSSTFEDLFGEDDHKNRARSNSPPKDSENDRKHKSKSRSRSRSTDSNKSGSEKNRKGSKGSATSDRSKSEQNTHESANHVNMNEHSEINEKQPEDTTETAE